MTDVAKTMGRNIKAQITNNKLVLEIDLTKTFGESKSGKNVIIASTGGNISVPGREDIRIGINAYKPA